MQQAGSSRQLLVATVQTLLCHRYSVVLLPDQQSVPRCQRQHASYRAAPGARGGWGLGLGFRFRETPAMSTAEPFNSTPAVWMMAALAGLAEGYTLLMGYLSPVIVCSIDGSAVAGCLATERFSK